MLKTTQNDYLKKFLPFVPNAIWSNLSQLIVILFYLILSILFTKLTSDENFGRYVMVFAIFNLFMIFSIPGLSDVVLRSLSQGYDGVYVKAAKLRFKCSFIAVPLILLTGIYYWIYRDQTIGAILLTIGLLFPFYASFNHWEDYLKARENFKQLFILNFFRSFVNTSVVVCVSWVCTLLKSLE